MSINWATATQNEKESELREYFKLKGWSRALYHTRRLQFNECNRWTTDEDLCQVCNEIIERFPKAGGVTYERLVLIYGQDHGQKKWESYLAKQKHVHSQEYLGKELFESRLASKENYIKKYGLEQYNSMRAKQAWLRTREGNIAKYGEELGLKRYNAMRAKQAWLRTREGVISRHGEEEWNRRFNILINNAQKIGFWSKVGRACFDEIVKGLPESIDIMYQPNTSELYLRSESGKVYYYDFAIPESKIIVEFQGDHWHANPNKYNADDVIIRDLTAKDIWAKDAAKKALAESQGFTVLYVWESVYRKNPESVVKSLTQEIRSLL